MSRTAYHINSSTGSQTYIGNKIVEISEIPIYSRNDNFTLIWKIVSGVFVSELDEAYRTEGEYICFKDGTETVWYGRITRIKYNEENDTYDFEAENIISNKYKYAELNDYIGYSKIGSGWCRSYDLSDYGQGYHYYMQVRGALENIVLSCNTVIITGVTWGSNMTSLDDYYYSHSAIQVLQNMNKMTVLEWLNRTCSAFGITIKFSAGKIEFNRIASNGTITRYNAEVFKEYTASSINSRDRSLREKKGILNQVCIDEYYRDLMAYPSGYFQVDITNLYGYYGPNGFYPYTSLTTEYYHGLYRGIYTHMKIINPEVATQDFEQRLDEEYEGKTFHPKSKTRIGISEAILENYPRIECSRTFTYNATNSGGKLLLTISGAFGDTSVNQMCTLFISKGAYKGTYYGDTISGDATYTFSRTSATTIRTNRNFTVATSVTVTVFFRLPIRSITTSGNDLITEFFVSTAAISAGTQDIQMLNTQREQKPTLSSFSYDYIYTKFSGNGTMYAWEWTSYSETELLFRTTLALHELNVPAIRNMFELTKKPESSSTFNVIAFPKHFFFFKSATLLNNYLLRMSGVYPVQASPTYVDGELYHLSHATEDRTNIKDYDQSQDISEGYDCDFHKEVNIEVREHELHIKQQELE